jgi:hypothetical protein
LNVEAFALARLLQQFGPQLGRPREDTLKGSRHANMKELRFAAADGEWRVAFAFDTKRKAILLVAGDKSGGSEKRFYRELIRKADARFDRIWPGSRRKGSNHGCECGRQDQEAEPGSAQEGRGARAS